MWLVQPGYRYLMSDRTQKICAYLTRDRSAAVGSGYVGLREWKVG